MLPQPGDQPLVGMAALADIVSAHDRRAAAHTPYQQLLDSPLADIQLRSNLLLREPLDAAERKYLPAPLGQRGNAVSNTQELLVGMDYLLEAGLIVRGGQGAHVFDGIDGDDAAVAEPIHGQVSGSSDCEGLDVADAEAALYGEAEEAGIGFLEEVFEVGGLGGESVEDSAQEFFCAQDFGDVVVFGTGHWGQSSPGRVWMDWSVGKSWLGRLGWVMHNAFAPPLLGHY
jgi:hypothetical protein